MPWSGPKRRVMCRLPNGRLLRLWSRSHGTEKALEAVLEPLEYRYYRLTSEGPRLSPHIVGDPHWRNYLLTT